MTDTEADLAAIEALHQRDIRASLAGDYKALRLLMSDEAVMLPPGQARQSGKSELDHAFRKMAGAVPDYEVLRYEQKWDEVRVFGDLAYEWGAITGASRKRSTQEVQEETYHVMRILRKERDGEWRVFRTIWAPGG